MNAPATRTAAPRCRRCGHGAAQGDAGAADRCARCHGRAGTMGDPEQPLQHGRGAAPIDFLRGFFAFFRAAGQTLHHRAFVGQLRWPIVANVLAAALLAGAAWLAWAPIAGLFAGEWPLLDGFRQAQADRGPFVLLVASVWLLWPIWFEVLDAGALTPLVAATECAIAGPALRAPATPAAESLTARVHRRARLLTTQLLLLPVVWVVALLPWVGLPLVYATTAALAATVWLELPAERRDVDVRTHQADLRHNWARTVGFGAALQLAVLVPVFNLVLLAPAAAVAAATIYLQFDKRGADPAQ